MWSRPTLVSDRAVGVEDVDRVEPPAQPDLEHQRVEARAREQRPRRASVPNSKYVSVVSPRARLDRRERLDERRVVGFATRDPHALVVAQQMRRGVAGRRGSRRRARMASSIAQVEPLPLVPPTVMIGQNVAAAASALEHRAHAVEAERDRARMQPLDVLEPGREVISRTADMPRRTQRSQRTAAGAALVIAGALWQAGVRRPLGSA